MKNRYRQKHDVASSQDCIWCTGRFGLIKRDYEMSFSNGRGRDVFQTDKGRMSDSRSIQYYMSHIKFTL